MKKNLENDKALYGAPIGEPIHSGAFLDNPESLPVPMNARTPSWHNGPGEPQDTVP